MYYLDSFFSRPQDAIVQSVAYVMLKEEYEQLNSLYARGEYTVFLGDSITRRFMLDEYFPAEKILNRGIFSDTTEGCLARLETNVNTLLPVKTFILIGHNDLPYRDSRQIVENIETIVRSISGGSKYLQSILPVFGDKPGINKRIVSINSELEKFCIETEGCVYIDLHSFYVDKEGGLDAKYSLDGVHLNQNGYDLWRRLIYKKIITQ